MRLLLLLVGLSWGMTLAAQTVRFPADAGVIDVTQAPYFAQPDDDQDDTEAIQAALDAYPSGNRIIYFPAGTYLISDSLRLPAPYKRTILQGEDQATTVLKLVDHCPGYHDPAQPRYLYRTAAVGFSADAFRNGLHDLTFDTGSGNPAAIAVQFFGSNQCQIERVTLRSGDGQGLRGLDLGYTRDNGPGLIRHLTVEGFETGVYLAHRVNSFTFEHLHLRGQSRYGLDNAQQVCTIRGLVSDNVVPALVNRDGGVLTVLEAQLEGKGPVAIDNRAQLYLRDCAVRGYAQAWPGQAAGFIGEYYTQPPAGPGQTPWRLPVYETPRLPWDALDQWANPEDFGANGLDDQDDTEAIQAAIDAGKGTVYFPAGRVFYIEDTLRIRGAVRRLIGTEARLGGRGVIVFEDGPAPVVRVERCFFIWGSQVTLRHQASRTLVWAYITGPGAIISEGRGDFFLDDVACGHLEFRQAGQRIFARQLDTEGRNAVNVANHGAHLWVLGYKTERAGPKVATYAGGRTEVLGGHIYDNLKADRQPPDDMESGIFISENSYLSVVQVRAFTSTGHYHRRYVCTETDTLLAQPLSADGFATFSWRSAPPPQPPRRRRSDSFWGLHFDLHAQASMDRGGASLRDSLLDALLQRTQPDYIQVDVKGHPGISSYPTQIGYPMAGFVRDPLYAYRAATARQGVALFGHFSGIYDQEVARRHPDWAIVGPAGRRSPAMLSTYSPYAQRYLIPQLRELAGRYGLDGAWVDGECWAIEPDYRPEAVKAFLRQQPDLKQAPRSRAEPGWEAWLAFQRGRFRGHVQAYVDSLHASHPGFQLTSNWAYSSMMPEPPRLPLDFLSGDLQPQNSVYSAAFESRVLAPQGRPWDLMAWSFTWSPEREIATQTKTAWQLQQEMAQVIAMGGGIQVYFRQNPDLSYQPWLLPVMEELADFARARQAWCHRAEAVPQVALLFSGESYLQEIDDIYPEWSQRLAPLKGLMMALLDRQYPVEIRMAHHLRGRMAAYPLLVVPDWARLEDSLRQELLAYAAGGGKLILVGPQTLQAFGPDLGLDTRTPPLSGSWWLDAGHHLGQYRGPLLPLPASAGRPHFFLAANDRRYPSPYPAALQRAYGQGTIVLLPFDLGQAYHDSRNPALREWLHAQITALDIPWRVQVAGNPPVHLALMQAGGQLRLNLLHAGGPHADAGQLAYEAQAPVQNLLLSLRLDQAPRQVHLQPSQTPLPFTYHQGQLSLIVPNLNLHEVIVVD